MGNLGENSGFLFNQCDMELAVSLLFKLLGVLNDEIQSLMMK